MRRDVNTVDDGLGKGTACECGEEQRDAACSGAKIEDLQTPGTDLLGKDV
jgi:hypothetical protein